MSYSLYLPKFLAVCLSIQYWCIVGTLSFYHHCYYYCYFHNNTMIFTWQKLLPNFCRWGYYGSEKRQWFAKKSIRQKPVCTEWVLFPLGQPDSEKSEVNNNLSFLPNLRVRGWLEKISQMKTIFFWNVAHAKTHWLVIGLYPETTNLMIFSKVSEISTQIIVYYWWELTWTCDPYNITEIW